MRRTGLALLLGVLACDRSPSLDFQPATAAACGLAADASAACPGAPAPSGCAATAAIDVNSLLEEMVDLGRLATVHGRTEAVMLDVRGPGAIVRLWTATADAGTLRVYLDDAPEPVIAADVAALVSGTVVPFIAPFASVTSSGKNLDFPIPFRRHAKVTTDGEVFYQVHYRLYEAGADVETLALERVAPEVLEHVAGVLRGEVTPADDGASVATCGGTGRQELVIQAQAGGSELTQLEIAPSNGSAETLRGTVLSLIFDGEETTRVPLGDLFGAGPGFHPHRMLPVEVSPDGSFVARFVMPFRCQAIVGIDSPPGRTATLSARHRTAAFTESSLHFFAHWIARGPIPTRPFRDLELAHVEGAGTYVGTLLAVDSRVRDWWGEGDEKVWVDGDTFPSWFGTGTEDYFGYANATNDPFEQPLRLLVHTGDAFGQVSNLRFHVLDAIPFRSSLVFDIELWHWNAATTVFYDTLSFFYAAPGARDVIPLPGSADFRLP